MKLATKTVPGDRHNPGYILHPVFRFIAIVLFALSVGQATGLAAAMETVCADQCPDDNDAGQCSPTCTCTTCGCHAVRVVVFLRVASIPAPSFSNMTFARSDGFVPAPDLDEILHVPKRLLG